MSAIVKMQGDEGVPILVEVRDPGAAGMQRVARDNTGRVLSTKSFEDALDRIRPVANAVVKCIREIDVTPEAVEVKFGLKLSVEADVIISSTAAEANFEFTLTWKPGAEKKGGSKPEEGGTANA